MNNTHFAVSPEIAYHQAMVLSNNQLHRWVCCGQNHTAQFVC